jgi:hypothetical protein
MAQRKSSNGGLPALIVFVLTITGGLAAESVGGSYFAGLLVGFLVGIAVIATVEYAATRIRRN